LKNKGINSQSRLELFLDKIKIEFPQNVEPEPTNESFKIYPENKLPKDKINNEKPIF
jgi:hypothetical protein